MPLSRITVKAPHTGGVRRTFKPLGMKRIKNPQHLDFPWQSPPNREFS